MFALANYLKDISSAISNRSTIKHYISATVTCHKDMTKDTATVTRCHSATVDDISTAESRRSARTVSVSSSANTSEMVVSKISTTARSLSFANVMTSAADLSSSQRSTLASEFPQQPNWEFVTSQLANKMIEI